MTRQTRRDEGRDLEMVQAILSAYSKGDIGVGVLLGHRRGQEDGERQDRR